MRQYGDSELGLCHSISRRDLSAYSIEKLIKNSLQFEGQWEERELHRLLVVFQENGLFELVRAINRCRATASACVCAISHRERTDKDLEVCHRILRADERKRERLVPELKRESLVFELVLMNVPTLQDHLSCDHEMFREYNRLKQESAQALSRARTMQRLDSLATVALHTEVGFVRQKYLFGGTDGSSIMDQLQNRYYKQFFCELWFFVLGVRNKRDMLLECGLEEINNELLLQRDIGMGIQSSEYGLRQRKSIKNFSSQAEKLLFDIKRR